MAISNLAKKKKKDKSRNKGSRDQKQYKRSTKLKVAFLRI